MEWLKENGEFLLAGVGVIVWLIRLEGKAIYNEKGLAKLEVKHEALDNKIVDKLSNVEKSLAKIEGYLQIETNNG